MTTVSRRRAVSPPGVPAPIKGYYSNAIRVDSGPLLFIAGQIPIDESGTLVGKGDVEAQAAQVYRNIEAILKGVGGSLENLVKVTVYLTDIGHLNRLTPLREQLFPKDGPASATVQVSALADPQMLIEVEGIAVID